MATDLSLADLDQRYSAEGTGTPPGGLKVRKLRTAQINEAPGAFQHRDTTADAFEIERHVKEIAQDAKAGDEFEPLTITPIAGEWWLADGHCRLAAYRLAEREGPVPVKVVVGRPTQVYGIALKENRRRKLNLSKRDRLEAAWQIVLRFPLGSTEGGPPEAPSVRSIARDSGASSSTVKNMRDRLRSEYPDWVEGREGDEPQTTWAEELSVRSRRRSETWTEELAELRLEKDATALAREWGHLMKRRPGYFLDVLERASGRVWNELLEQAKWRLEPEDF